MSLISEFAKWVEPLNSGCVERSLNQLVTSFLHLAWQPVKENNSAHFLFMYYAQFALNTLFILTRRLYFHFILVKH